MKNVMAILNLNENEENLYELTKHRPVSAIPFGGRYRLIDFALSNLVNSGIINVGILMPEKFGPLIDHTLQPAVYLLAAGQHLSQVRLAYYIP